MLEDAIADISAAKLLSCLCAREYGSRDKYLALLTALQIALCCFAVAPEIRRGIILPLSVINLFKTSGSL